MIVSKYIRRKLNKLSTLQHRFKNVEFKYVPTEQNPADVALRGVNLVRDSENRIHLWLNGPAFLTNNQNWPVACNVTQHPVPAEIAVHEKIPPTLKGAQEWVRTSLMLNKLIHEHSSLTVLVHDVAVLTLFTQFMMVCHRVRVFPNHTSWRE